MGIFGGQKKVANTFGFETEHITDQRVLELLGEFLDNFSNEVLGAYNFNKGKHLYGKGVFVDYAIANVTDINTSLKQVILNYYTKSEVVYKKINFNGVELVLTNPIEDMANKNVVTLNSGVYSVLKAIKMQDNGNNTFKALKTIMGLVDKARQAVVMATSVKPKIFVKIKGLTNLMQASQQSTTFERFLDSIKNGVREIFTGDVGFVDGETTFETVAVDIVQPTAVLNTAYTELARVLGLPVADITGATGTGLGNYGVFETKKHFLAIETMRNNVITPFLQGLDIPFTLAKGVNVAELVQLDQLILSSGQNPLIENDVITNLASIYKQLVLQAKQDGLSYDSSSKG